MTAWQGGIAWVALFSLSVLRCLNFFRFPFFLISLHVALLPSQFTSQFPLSMQPCFSWKSAQETQKYVEVIAYITCRSLLMTWDVHCSFLFVLQRGSGEVCCNAKELQPILMNGRKSATRFIALFHTAISAFLLAVVQCCPLALPQCHPQLCSLIALLLFLLLLLLSHPAAPCSASSDPISAQNRPLILLLLWLSLLATFSSCY